MSLYGVFSILFTLAVGVTYINARFIRLPSTIAIMMASLLLSLLLILMGLHGFGNLESKVAGILNHMDFHALLMNGMLSFLLFAGALTVNISDLSEHKWEIGILAIFSTILSTFLVGSLSYILLNNFLNLHMAFIYCLLFGALISPTDPIAVLAMLKELRAPKSLEVMVAGESLFNDGVAIVLFLTLYHVAFMGGTPSGTAVLGLFLREAVGGIVYGIILGLSAYWLMKSIQDHSVQILITLGVATGGYALAPQ